MRSLSTLLVPLAAVLLSPDAAFAQAIDPLRVDILYVEQRLERPPVLSNLVAWPEDEGERGAALGILDNDTTGRFLNQDYTLETLVVEADEDIVAAVRPRLADGARLLVLNVEAEPLLAIADLPEAADDLLFNARASELSLRDVDCRANVLHTMASRAMLSDALMQFLALRRWRELFLLVGNRTGDIAFADALRGSAKKFGLKLVVEKRWLEEADLRRNAAQEVPALTRGDYDVLLVTDEDRDFSQYVLYNTWLPRPVAGSAGLMPVVWSSVVEQWGAAQLQSRFTTLAARAMSGVDYANWAAVRAIGEAVTRTGETTPGALRDYLLSDAFELAGFKGASLGFRRWNGQLRQPVPLVHSDALVATAPLEGYLHARTELDTLGLDEPESACEAFAD